MTQDDQVIVVALILAGQFFVKSVRPLVGRLESLSSYDSEVKAIEIALGNGRFSIVRTSEALREFHTLAFSPSNFYCEGVRDGGV